MSNRLSTIIYFCWKNRDIISSLFVNYWKNCPYQMVLVTDVYYETDKQYVFNQGGTGRRHMG